MKEASIEEWSQMIEVLTYLDIVWINTKNDDSNCIHKLNCHYTQKDLKFNVSLKKTSKKEELVIEFKLRAGESREFRELIDRIVNTFEGRKSGLIDIPSIPLEEQVTQPPMV